jgi:uncharacterized protein (TIGR02246 family)
MPSIRLIVLGVLASLSLTCALAYGEDIEEIDAREAIDTATRRFVEAFNAGEVGTMKSLWTERADFIDQNGKRIFFQDRINAAAELAKKNGAPVDPSTLVMTINTVRFITPQVATVDGTSIYTASGQSDPTHSRYTAVWTLRGNNWLLDSLRENQIAQSQHNAHLEELAWMVGHWADTEIDPRFECQIRWTNDGNYLECEFKSQLFGRGEHSGVERIGWDAQLGQFRSWTFRHDGGFSQSIWTAAEKGWMIEISGVTAGGQPMGGQKQLVKRNGNTIDMIYTNGTLGGQMLPDFQLRILRKGTKQRI